MRGWRQWATWALAAWAAGPVHARDTWALATADLPPAITTKAADLGYYAVILRRVFDEMDINPEFHFLPPARAQLDAAQGLYAALFPAARTPERELTFLASDPFYVVRLRVFLRRDDAWAGSTVEDFKDGLLCNVQGVRTYPELEAALDAGRLKMQRVTDLSACFRMLAVGRVRFVVTGENTGHSALHAMGEAADQVRMAPVLLSEQPVHLMFPRVLPESARRVRDFNRALQRLRRSGELNRLEQRVVPKGPIS